MSIRQSTQGVNELKLRLIQYDNFYNGLVQLYNTECLLMLTAVICTDSMPGYGPNNNLTASSYGVSLSDFLFSFILEKYIVCDICGLKPPLCVL